MNEPSSSGTPPAYLTAPSGGRWKLPYSLRFETLVTTLGWSVNIPGAHSIRRCCRVSDHLLLAPLYWRGLDETLSIPTTRGPHPPPPFARR